MDTLSRRRFLSGLTAAGGILLVACGGGSPATAPPATAPLATTAPTVAATVAAQSTVAATSVPTRAAAATVASGAATPANATATGRAATASAAPVTLNATPATRTARTPRGELRVLVGTTVGTVVDATKGGFTWIRYGAAETLTRVRPDGTLELWLAEQIVQQDATNWRVTIRQGAQFWDGSAVTADDVIAAFARNWKEVPAASGILSKDTVITAVDQRTLNFKTPGPTGNFPNALSGQNFSIHKDTGKQMTGPYRVTQFTPERTMTLEAFADHWAGPPPIAKITITSIADANARVLGLQAGDADMLYVISPDVLPNFDAQFEVLSVPSTRVHMIQFNYQRPLFADRAVREAMSLGIDRTLLFNTVMEGQGAIATGLFPPNGGMEVVPLQSFDAARSQQVLDAAGWQVGAGGVRAKGGQRLAFTLYSYPARPELTPLGVAIQAQLKPLGFDIQLQQVQDINTVTNGGNFDAVFYSGNTLITGDPLYWFNQTLVKDAPNNPGGYNNAEIERLVGLLRAEPNPAQRAVLSRQVQEVVRTDVTCLYLAFAPQISVAKKGKLQGFVSHPSDQYFINNTFSVS